MVLVMLDGAALLRSFMATAICARRKHPLTLPTLRVGPLPLPRKRAGEGLRADDRMCESDSACGRSVQTKRSQFRP